MACGLAEVPAFIRCGKVAAPLCPMAALGDTGFSERACRPPKEAAARRRERMQRLANGMFAAARHRSRCPEMTGPSRRGRLVGVIRRTYTLLRADFLHFVSFRISAAAILLLSLRKIFPTGRLKRNGYFSETKCPPERAGKPPKGSRRNSRNTGGKKTSGGPAWPAAKKPSRDGTRSGPARSPETGRLPPDVPLNAKSCRQARRLVVWQNHW